MSGDHTLSNTLHDLVPEPDRRVGADQVLVRAARRRRTRLVALSLASAAVVTTGAGLLLGDRGQEAPRGSAGLAGPEAVAACSERIAWGTVQDVAQAGTHLRVTVRVDSWVRPTDGPATAEFTVDDPAREVGAPVWRAGERYLIVESHNAPTQQLRGAEADALVGSVPGAGAKTTAGCGRG